jgi:putative FmdB family regulatory protein
MPTYRYICEKCGEEFTKRRSTDQRDAEVSCTACDSQEVKRALSRFAVSSGGSSAPACADSGGCASGSCPFA